MDKIFNFKANCGLDVTFIQKRGFITKYAAIGIKYGSSIRSFTLDGREYRMKSGLAHFIEHKIFRMEDGKDALETFNDMNAFANAYTQREKTVYYFKTRDNFIEPFKLLMNMVYTPIFIDEDIENEKEIIISELYDTLDDIDSLEYFKEQELLYPNDDYSIPVIGTVEDIKATKKEDLYLLHEAFYTPNNSKMVVVGDLELDDLKNMINNELDKLKLPNKNPIVKSSINSITVNEPTNYYTYPNIIHILARLDSINYTDTKSIVGITGILESLFKTEAKFFNELVEKKLLLSNGIDYTCEVNRFSSCFSLDIYTNKPKELISIIINKLKNLSESDIDKKIVDGLKREMKADYLYSLDSIQKIGNKTIDLLLEDSGYDDIFIEPNEEIIKSYIEHVKNASYTWIISKK